MVADLHQLASVSKHVGAFIESAYPPRLQGSGKVSHAVHPI